MASARRRQPDDLNLDAANQLAMSIDSTGATTLAFDAAGNQPIGQAPPETTTNVWNYENRQTAVLLPCGVRETMTYSADLRQHSREV